MKQTTGRQRAEARYKAKLKANEAIPSGEHMTRQRRRALARANAKQLVSDTKKLAAKKNPGGAASVHRSDLIWKDGANVQ